MYVNLCSAKMIAMSQKEAPQKTSNSRCLWGHSGAKRRRMRSDARLFGNTRLDLGIDEGEFDDETRALALIACSLLCSFDFRERFL